MIASYISVFSAIVIGLAVADLAMSFHKLMRHRERVRWDWLIFAAALLVLLNLVAVWWVTLLWYGGVRDMTIAAYLPDLAILLLLFLTTAAILPDEVPAEGLDRTSDHRARAALPAEHELADICEGGNPELRISVRCYHSRLDETLLGACGHRYRHARLYSLGLSTSGDDLASVFHPKQT